MLHHPLQLQCSEKLPDEPGEFEMYSVKFVLSVASRRAQDKVERQQNRSHKLGAYVPVYPSPDDLLVPSSVRDWQLG
jgi:hypothetical protein